MGVRSGTLPTHQIVGMGEAARLASKRMKSDNDKIAALSQRFLDKTLRLEGVSLNGDRALCVPAIISLRFDGVESESLMMALGDVAVSPGSACTSASVEPSHVLMAMGLGEDAAHSSLRVSVGRFTAKAEVDYAARRIAESVRELRAISLL